jgi:uncharacterized membrane protein (DUF4010 family)
VAAGVLVLAWATLPLVPLGPYPALAGLQPRWLWGLVLLFSSINFFGYLARRALGPERGYALTGLLGGVVSSTAVTLQFSRISHDEPENGESLGLGVAAACTILPLRVMVISVAMNSDVALALVRYLLPAVVTGVLLVGFAIGRPSPPVARIESRNPLRFMAALQMAVLFQLAIMLLDRTRAAWGTQGVLVSAIGLGVADADALTVSMNRLVSEAGEVSVGAMGITIGLLASTVFKLGLSIWLGRGAFRKWAVRGLVGFVLAFAVGLVIG